MGPAALVTPAPAVVSVDHSIADDRPRKVLLHLDDFAYKDRIVFGHKRTRDSSGIADGLVYLLACCMLCTVLKQVRLLVEICVFSTERTHRFLVVLLLLYLQRRLR